MLDSMKDPSFIITFHSCWLTLIFLLLASVLLPFQGVNGLRSGASTSELLDHHQHHAALLMSCQQDSLTKCTDPLKVLTNNRDLGFAASKQELNALCPKLIDGLRCIDNFTGRCLDAQHREFFHMLYAGTKQVIVDLCQDDDYQKEYLSHAPCMRIVQTGYEQCAIEYQSHVREQQQNNGGNNHLGNVSDDPVENSKKLCCSFQNYMKCSQSVVEGTCGSQTAAFTRGFLDTMAGPLIQGYCLSYEPGTADADCSNFGSPQHQDTSGYVRSYEPMLDRVSQDESGNAGSVMDEMEFIPGHQHHSSSSSGGRNDGSSSITFFALLLTLYCCLLSAFQQQH